MSDMEIKNFVESEDAFRAEVARRITEGKKSFVLIVYELLDECLNYEFQRSGMQIACHKGCSACCYQLVSCTEIEWAEIKRYINHDLPQTLRVPLRQMLKKFAKEWRTYYEKNKHLINNNPWKPVKDLYGKPCPFLSERTGKCNIYPVRTIDCRTYWSKTKCSNRGIEEEVKRFIFPCEQWANNMIMEEQKRISKSIMYVVYLPHWVCLWQQNKK